MMDDAAPPASKANFPGFPEGIDGPTLMEQVKKQAETFGTEYRFRRSDRGQSGSKRAC